MADRTELKRAYRATPKHAGVYRITCTVNGKVYLASSLNLHGVLERDRFVLGMGSHMCAPLQADYRALGADAFTFDVAETLPVHDDPAHDYSEDLEILEQIWIDRVQPYGDKGYNTPGKRIRRV